MKITVPDMSCNHCVMKIQKQLLIDGVQATVDLKDKSVNFKKDADLEKVTASVKKAGYSVQS
ncbi:MAG TPA: heavy-metal-associated domain-containing protein [Acholeplasmataceae bacterium]|jgi:copper chaperone CopZ|nr:heavy-metal-associated domain-containing protein [Acholeplasmataceae bacterium]